MPHASPPRRQRRSRPLVIALLAGLLAATAGGPAPEARGAKPGRDLLATTTTRLEAGGRASFRALAAENPGRRRGWVPPAPPRVGWERRAPSGGSTGSGTGSGSTATGSTGAGAAAGSTGAGAAAGVASAGTAATRAAATAVFRPVPATGAADAEPPGALEPAASGGPGVIGPAWYGLTDQAVTCGTSRPCVEPASPSVAVSETHVVQAVSEATRITNRNGTGASQASNRSFFGVASWSATALVAEPRVVYDRANGRWIATLFAGTCSGGAVFFAVSTSPDPTGEWDRYRLTFSGRWPDSPTLGISSTLVAVGVNEAAVSCGGGGTPIIGAYRGTRLHVLDLAAVEAGDGLPLVASTDPDPAAFAATPAVAVSPEPAIHALVALDDGSTNRADVGYVAIDGSVAGGLTVRAPVNLTTELGLAKLATPPTPVDAGGLIGVQRNALDLRPTGATWRDGRLLVTSTGRCAVGSTTRPCGRVTELATDPDLGAPTLRQDLRISPTAGFTDTFVPGATYADDGTVWVAYSQAGAGRYVSSWGRRQVPGAPVDAWSQGSVLIAAGRGPYGGTAGAGLNERWGDHVAVVPDPLVAGAAWQANQVADTGGGWTTRVARLGDDVTPPGIGIQRPRIATRVTASATSVKLDIGWTASDAGSGVASVAVERSVDGGDWVPVATAAGTATSARVTVAYGRRYAFRLRATDHAGNPSGWVAGVAFTPVLVGERSSSVSYRGTWTTGRSSSYLGGRDRYTGVARRRSTLTFSGIAAAWVGSTGPTRGRARIYADGTSLGTVGAHASKVHHRQVLAARTYSTSGRHTFRVEVVGTAGHPRIDVDGFVILR
jgi:hypothetical protein